MGAIASQITSLTIVYSTVYSDADQRKHQSSASLAFVWGIHRGPVNSPHKWPVTRKIFPFDDVIILWVGVELATGHCRNQRLLRLVTHKCISRPQWVNLLLPKVDTWLRRYLPTLAPVRRQTTSRTNVDWLPIGSLETNCEIWIRWQTFSKMHFKMASAKCYPFCSGLIVLILTKQNKSENRPFIATVQHW